MKGKAEALTSAFKELGIEPGAALKAKGEAILALMSQNKLTEADQALDALAKETGANEPTSTEEIDFSKFDTGSTELSTLQERYTSVSDRAKELTHLPTLRLLVKGRDALEKAKAAEDAAAVARILTWAEGILAKQ